MYEIKNHLNELIATTNGNESILDALIKSEFYPSYSCTIGKCGSCKIPLLNGRIKMKLSPSFYLDKNKEILPCISYAESNIKIHYPI